MSYKYLLLVLLKGGKTESYYADSANKLQEYAEFRKFTRYEIFELKKIIGSDDNGKTI